MKILREIILIAGFLMYMYGAWKIYPPLAYTTGGIAMIWFAHPPKSPKKKGIK